jgi:hypothetical protein
MLGDDPNVPPPAWFDSFELVSADTIGQLSLPLKISTLKWGDVHLELKLKALRARKEDGKYNGHWNLVRIWSILAKICVRTPDYVAPCVAPL